MILRIACFVLIAVSVIRPIYARNIETQLNAMTDQELAAQMILVYYTTPEFISKHAFGGILIMQNMLKEPARLKQELALLQSQLNNKMLVTIDQEGGKVNRMKYLKGWENVPAANAISQWSDQQITAHSSKMAHTLKEIGINMNLAPVLDPSHDFLGRKAFMGHENRAFSRDSSIISSAATAFVKGFQSNGIASTVKHFPGYDALTNSDHQIALSNAPKEVLDKQVKAFAALSPHVESVMMSSIHFTAVNGKPAVLSPAMLKWAREIFPDAIIMTDDLWGTALRSWMKDHGARSKNAQLLSLSQLAIEAGNDILMITYPEKAVLMKKNIAKWMQDDDALREKIRNAVRRILTVKAAMGLFDMP